MTTRNDFKDILLISLRTITMSSSIQDRHPQPVSAPHGATAAPPPTPASQTNCLSSPDAADALSKLIRLPPSLSLPSRLSPRTTSPPLIPFSSETPNFLHPYVPSFSKLGFFQLTHLPISTHLASSAESESLELFDLPRAEKQDCFSKTWPMGYDNGEEEEEEEVERRGYESFCFDESCESTRVSLSSLRELTRELEKVGVEIVEALGWALGFEKELKERETRFSSLMWVSEGAVGEKKAGRFYPYIVALQYQVRCTKYNLLTDSGWVAVSPQVESVLVTIGDIAQVWSNGKLKKVRGRPVAVSGKDPNSRCVTMSLLVTLPTDIGINVSPFVSAPSCGSDGTEEAGNQENSEQEKPVFDTFSFEDYAWRVYNERFLFKDPLDRYRLQSDGSRKF